MDFSEIIVAIIIWVIIFTINLTGSKKQQSSKNQPKRKPIQNRVPNTQPLPEEPWDESRTLTLDDIFQELRKAREEAEASQPQVDDDYIPKAPKPVPVDEPVKRPKAPAIRRESEPAVAFTAPQVENPLVTPRETIPSAKPVTAPSTGYEIAEEPIMNIQEIDWRKAVIASEILNRKY